MSISLIDWLEALAIVFSMVTIIILIMSIVSMFIVGPKKYFKQLRCLWKFKIDKSFIKTHTFKTNFTPLNGRMFREDYYFFVDVIGDNEIVVVKCLSPYFSFWNIQIIKKVNNEWTDEEFKISMSSCLISQSLKGIIGRKMKRESLNSTRIEDTNTINDFLNTEVVQLSRDRKLKELLK